MLQCYPLWDCTVVGAGFKGSKARYLERWHWRTKGWWFIHWLIVFAMVNQRAITTNSRDNHETNIDTPWWLITIDGLWSITLHHDSQFVWSCLGGYSQLLWLLSHTLSELTNHLCVDITIAIVKLSRFINHQFFPTFPHHEPELVTMNNGLCHYNTPGATLHMAPVPPKVLVRQALHSSSASRQRNALSRAANSRNWWLVWPLQFYDLELMVFF